MEDLASIVLDQLQHKDGAGPFSLLYTQELAWDTSALVATAARVNGTVVYELSYFVAPRVDHLRRWKHVSYCDSRAAASFAMSFILRNDHDQALVQTFATFETADLVDLFGEAKDGGAALFGKAVLENYQVIADHTKAIGVRTLQCESQLRNALVSLMPLSVQLG